MMTKSLAWRLGSWFVVAVSATGGCSSSNDAMQAGSGAQPASSTSSATSAASSSSSGGSSTSASSGSGSGGAPFVAAKHRALPQVLNLGGPFVKAPKVLPIAYMSDSGLADMTEFLGELTSTSYWSAVTSEYGVGALTILPTVYLTEPPPAMVTDATLTAELASNTSGTAPPWGTADANTIYLFLMPTGTTISYSGALSCQSFGGYHDAATVGSVQVPYAVVAACPKTATTSVSDLRTISASHELIEATTDPYIFTDPAWSEEDVADIVWGPAAGGGELADMCSLNRDVAYLPPGAKHQVSRSWSDAAAKASKNPCVPAPVSLPYFDSIPTLGPISWDFAGSGTTFKTQGLQIPIGQSKTIDVNLFSDAPLPGPWTVNVYDYDTLIGQSAKLTVSLDQKTGNNGDTLHLTITPKAADTYFGGEVFVIVSDYGMPGDADFTESVSLGVVIN